GRTMSAVGKPARRGDESRVSVESTIVPELTSVGRRCSECDAYFIVIRSSVSDGGVGGLAGDHVGVLSQQKAVANVLVRHPIHLRNVAAVIGVERVQRRLVEWNVRSRLLTRTVGCRRLSAGVPAGVERDRYGNVRKANAA